MSNRWPIVWLLSVSFVPGCGRVSERPEASVAAPRPLVRIGLERTPCFGFCPEYQLSVTATGHIVFRGTGRWDGIERTWHIPADSVGVLAREFASVNFFQLGDITHGKPECGRAATDHPSIVLTASDGEREHRVHYYTGCLGPDSIPAGDTPDRLHNPTGVLGTLKRLANRIDSVTQSTVLIDSLQAARTPSRGA